MPVFAFLLLAAPVLGAGPSDGPLPAHENKLGMRFVHIPAGRFTMGSPERERLRGGNETPHEVVLTKDFYLQATEVTRKQWNILMGKGKYGHPDCGENCPAERMRLPEIEEFLRWLNQKEPEGTYRLPTEAEWEYACRAGTTTMFHWGDTPDCSRANFGNSLLVATCKGANPGKPAPVGSYPPNAWGLYDMHGNVAEWTSDVYAAYPKGPATDPCGAESGPFTSVRGGGYDDPWDKCRSAYRDYRPAAGRSGKRGFRTVWVPDPAESANPAEDPEAPGSARTETRGAP
jgi:formylglycine-generating enzyme required for sulfatase activity